MKLRRDLKAFVQRKALCPPISLRQLETLAEEYVNGNNLSAELISWLMVEINNQLWVDIIASIPYDRRILMLPKCLSKHGECKGEFDEYGLLCHRCGLCTIPSLQDHADRLGSLSIVAEGFTQVIELIENNVVDAVIGVSCLSSLEKAFPLLVSHAVPGLAIVLNNDGCMNTNVDQEYVEELLSTTYHPSPTTQLLNHQAIRKQIDNWFSSEELACMLDNSDDHTMQVCLRWMTTGGKRWRPYLLCAVYQAISGDVNMNEDVHRAAVAVECFHKASLIHDDIEDKDMERYGQPTVNALYGDTYAINAGDALLGEGYRILAHSNNMELERLIAEAHVSLCKGQGTELQWCANPHPIDIDFSLSIFRNKTVPAFEVSLLLGLACTGNHLHLRPMLKAYSEAIGIAYQLKDDLEDLSQDSERSEVKGQRLGVRGERLGVRGERLEGRGQKTLTSNPSTLTSPPTQGDSGGLLSPNPSTLNTPPPSAVYALRCMHPKWSDDDIRQEISQMVCKYKQQALDSLIELDCLELKRLLYQVTEKII